MGSLFSPPAVQWDLSVACCVAITWNEHFAVMTSGSSPGFPRTHTEEQMMSSVVREGSYV